VSGVCDGFKAHRTVTTLREMLNPHDCIIVFSDQTRKFVNSNIEISSIAL